jgi:predicted dehydrogenase
MRDERISVRHFRVGCVEFTMTSRIEKRKVKVGVVGCGVVATAYYLPCLMQMDTVEITAVCDLYESRTRACLRLFGAREQYLDYDEMLRQADLDAVFILTAPGTHVPFSLRAIEAGKHILLQKPMATEMKGARRIAAAVRQAGVKALVEPSSGTPLDPDVAHLRHLVRQGVLGDILWFSLAWTGPATYHPSLGSNPYGQDAFYTRDSGGFLFDLPYAPTEIVGVLGPCKSVTAHTRLVVTDHRIVPEAEYDRFLEQVNDPLQANYWDVVLDLPRAQPVRMEAVDQAYSLYEMVDGSIGACHVGRIYHPVLPGTGGGSLQVFGTDGNLLFGAGYKASIITRRSELLPHVDADGWYHIPLRGDLSQAKWPRPVPGGFNYYHESTRHFIDCILEDRDPLVNVEWGLHITEMMAGAVESSRSGMRYEMTTSLEY